MSLTAWASGGKPLERRLYALAAVLMASGVAHLGVQAVAGGPWDGPVSWRKPATFGLAFGLTLATITWLSGLLELSGRGRRAALVTFAGACCLEVTVITLQAWRGVPSHFNTDGPLNSALAYGAAAGGVVLVLVTAVLAGASVRRRPDVPIALRVAMRIGLGTFTLALAAGIAMIAVGVAAERAGTLADAYAAAARYKTTHAAFMHGVLLLPGLAWLGERTTWSQVRRLEAAASAGTGFVLAAGAVGAMSVGLLPALPAVALAATGTALVLWTAIGTVWRLHQDAAQPPPRSAATGGAGRGHVLGGG